MQDEAFQKNTSIWERIYAGGEAGYNLEYPCEDLIVAVNRYFLSADPRGKKLLDIGFGSGNNLVFLAEKGFNCYGIEVSSSAIELTRKRLSQKGLQTELKLIKGDVYPFEANFFDVIITWHVLSYNDEESLRKTITEIRRVLKPEGVILATFSTFKDFCVKHGKKVGNNTFELVHKESNQKGAIFVAAEDEAAVREIFKDFSNLEIGYSEISIKGITNSHWLIYGS